MKLFCIVGSIIYALFSVLVEVRKRPVPAVSTSESLARLAVKNGGGQWVGVQENEGMPYDLVLFNSPKTGSTLALKDSDITAEGVRRSIKESDAKFDIKWSEE